MSKKSFTLTPKMEKVLRDRLVAHHNLYPYSPCKDVYLEETLVHALRADTTALENVIWRAASHRVGRDILAVTTSDDISINVKSGDREFVRPKGHDFARDNLRVSSHRLQTHKRDLVAITAFLKKNKPDLILAVPYNENTGEYQVVYIDREVLAYPEPEAWQTLFSKTGKPSGYYYDSGEGFIAHITFNTSDELWISLHVPTCRLGPQVSVKS